MWCLHSKNDAGAGGTRANTAVLFAAAAPVGSLERQRTRRTARSEQSQVQQQQQQRQRRQQQQPPLQQLQTVLRSHVPVSGALRALKGRVPARQRRVACGSSWGKEERINCYWLLMLVPLH